MLNELDLWAHELFELLLPPTAERAVAVGGGSSPRLMPRDTEALIPAGRPAANAVTPVVGVVVVVVDDLRTTAKEEDEDEAAAVEQPDERQLKISKLLLLVGRSILIIIVLYVYHTSTPSYHRSEV